MVKYVPVVPTCKAMRLYSEKSSLQPSSFSPQCSNAMSLLSIFPEVFCTHISKYIYIVSPFYTKMAANYTSCSSLAFFFFKLNVFWRSHHNKSIIGFCVLFIYFHFRALLHGRAQFILTSPLLVGIWMVSNLLLLQ